MYINVFSIRLVTKLLVCDMEVNKIMGKKRVCAEKLKVWKPRDGTVKTLFQKKNFSQKCGNQSKC